MNQWWETRDNETQCHYVNHHREHGLEKYISVLPKDTPAEDRTGDLWIRGLLRYPLRYVRLLYIKV